MKCMYLASLLFLVVGCSGGQTTGGDDRGGAGKAQLKQAAAEARAQPSPGSSPGSSSGDVCANEGWYGDGECDTFCRDSDAKDCTPNSDGVVCALFIEEANGFCSRKGDDPCIQQDPDCSRTPPVACTDISRPSDGVCKDDPSDPCDVYQDPDCSGNGGATPTDPAEPTEPPICTAIAQAPDGVCKDDPKDPCDFYQDPDCHGGIAPTDPGVPTCKAEPEASDGVCDKKPGDPCLALDPDCTPINVCPLLLEEPDGVCKREPNDPCIFQDPDCRVK